MSGLIAIMDELAATLEAVIGTSVLGEDGAQIVPRLNLNPTGLSIDIYPGDPFTDDTGAGFGDATGRLIFTVRARVNLADIDGGQEALLDLMDDESERSVAVTLLDDQTLNGRASSVYVEGPSGYQVYGDNPGSMLGAQWRVTILNVTT